MKGKGIDDGKGMGGIKFLAAACLIYLAAGLANPGTAIEGLGIFWGIIISIIPAMVLVFGMMFLVNMFISPGKVARYMGEGSGLKGWLIAVGGGIISTGPVYLWYRILADMRKQGMKDSLIAAFIYSRAVKVPLLPLMVYYFGWLFTAVLTFYMVAFSIINGFIVGLIGGARHENSC